jgi:T-complex protein 1 subunit beta
LLIIEGFREAKDCALEVLKSISIEGSLVKEEFREELLKIARTTISSKLLTYEKEHFAQLAVDAVLRLDSSSNLDLI